ncbi:MAG: hypothetical protein KJZ80_14630 [Hyphomicrobiaceae bacterium]|nr:hypothetical protein [Hyphomicrobiaceae bacterium]
MRLLRDIAYVRSGDKGDTASFGIIAKEPAHYPEIVRNVTPQRVQALYADWSKGPVEVYRMDNIEAVMVVMRRGLGGGATRTLRLDQTGKSLGHALLRLRLDEP